MIIVAVSGGFDPVHNGHIRMFKEAKKLGDKLMVIINNDNWLRTKKGYVFMPEEMRAEIISELKCVDEVYITKHLKDDPDRSVCKALEELKPDIFANGGDRFAYNVPERELCERLGIKMVFNVGGEKIASSSELVKLSNIVFGHDDDQEFVLNNVLGLKG
jgi:cytidyltransferase-like protein